MYFIVTTFVVLSFLPIYVHTSLFNYEQHNNSNPSYIEYDTCITIYHYQNNTKQRTLNKATIAADTIKTNIANDSEDALEAISTIKNIKLIPMECDLADLKSIDKFVNDLKKANGASFDAVCYNAGLARNTEASDVLRTAQGFELTIGTNHLGHFYLNNLMMPLINKDTGRIVVTASSVHDPDSPGGAQGKTATLGDLKGLEDAVASGTGKFDMVDGGSFNADKAYKDSKLCNVLFTRELQRRLDESGSNIKVNSFTPG